MPEIEPPPPSSPAEQIASQTAYEDLSPPEVQELLEQEFAATLNSLDRDPAPLPGEPVRFYSDQAVVVDPGGGKPFETVVSSVPLRVAGDDGREQLVDLRLEPTADGFRPANPLVDVKLPEALSAPLTLGELQIEFPGAVPASAETVRGTELLYPDAYRDTDIVATPLTTGVETFAQLRSAESPESLALDIGLPAGAHLESGPRGSAVVMQGSETLAVFLPPTAIDADKRPVDVSMEIQGSELRLSMPHRNRDLTYPVLVDPAAYFIWGDEQNQQPPPSQPSFLYDWDPHEQNPWQSYSLCRAPTECNLWWGLHVGAPVGGYYLENDFGRWYWRVPRWPDSTAYIDAAKFLVSAYPGEWDNPYGRVSVSSPYYYIAWEDITVPESNWWHEIYTWQNGAAQQANFELIHWFEQGGTDNWAYLGAGQIWVNDPEVPSVSINAHSDPTLLGRWTDDTAASVTATARDPGLGVMDMDLFFWRDLQGNVYQDNHHHGCLGVYRTSPCPKDWQRTFGYDTSDLAEGVNQGSVWSKDPNTYAGGTPYFYLYIDRSRPEVELSGGLSPGSGPQGTDLHVEATDGSTSPPITTDDWTTARSGMKRIELFIDGASVASEERDCPLDPADGELGSCPLALDFSLAPGQQSGGEHTFTVVATDQLGQETVEEWTETLSGNTLECTDDSEPVNFQHYSLGPIFEGELAGDPIRRCDEPYPGEPVRANYVSYLYGICVGLPVPGAPLPSGGCAPPVEIQTWASCERSLADYELEPAVAYPSNPLGDRRGVPAYSFDGGTRVELYAGNATIVIFGDDPDQVSRAVGAVRAEPPSAPPGPPNAGGPGGDLPAPAAGAMDGTLPCDPQAPPVEPQEPGADAPNDPITPEVPFAYGGLDCGGSNAEPVTTLFTDGVESEIAEKTGWSPAPPAADDGKTKSLAVGSDCVLEGTGYMSTGSLVERDHLPLWVQPTPGGSPDPDGFADILTFGTPHHETRQSCGWVVDAPENQASGFDRGRRSISESFEPNPVGIVYWGNTRSMMQCSSRASASNGNVAFAQKRDLFGYNEDWNLIFSQPSASDPVAIADAGGSTSARIPLYWSDVETAASEPGECARPATYNWSAYDPVYNRMLELGIRPILAVSSAPCWAQPQRCPPGRGIAPPGTAFDNDWAAFVAAAASHFNQAGGIEIWNEPNQELFWGGCEPSANRYATLLARGFDAVNSVQPSMPVLTAGMVPFENNSDKHKAWRTYLTNVDETFGPRTWDAIGLHPYRRGTDRNNHRAFDESAIRQYRAAKKLELGHPLGIWVTEVGVTTSSPDDSDDPILVKDEEARARHLRRIYKALSDLGAKVVIIHRLRDLTEENLGPDVSPREKATGVLFSDLTCKPAFRTLALARGQSVAC